MPNTAQPAGISRHAIGEERPPQSYAITPEGRDEVLFKTYRLEDGSGWSTSVTGEKSWTSHKLSVEAGIATLPEGWRDGEGAEVLVQTPDGKCGRATGAGTPCKSQAGSGTDHLGAGACSRHEGQPLLEGASA